MIHFNFRCKIVPVAEHKMTIIKYCVYNNSKGNKIILAYTVNMERALVGNPSYVEI